MITTTLIILFMAGGLLVRGCLATEKTLLAFLSFAIVLGVSYFVLDFDFVTVILGNPPLALGVFHGYLVAGGLYSSVRWFFRMRRTAAKLAEVCLLWQAPLGGYDRVRKEKEALIRKMIPARHKGLIVGWITFWPLDACALLFEEPVLQLWVMLTSTYRRIAKQALAKHGLDEEFGKEIEKG